MLGYIQDSASGPVNSATEFKNDIGPHLKDTFFWDRADVLALYPTASTIGFYDYVTNEVGSSAASARYPFNLSPILAPHTLS